MIFVDSNIILDLVAQGEWTEWAERRLADTREPLVVNAIVVAEVAPSFQTLATERVFLDGLEIKTVDISPEAAFRAGKAHAAYRAAGGRRSAILADFVIAGHAATLKAKLLTRDRRDFASYFPELTLITPETHP